MFINWFSDHRAGTISPSDDSISQDKGANPGSIAVWQRSTEPKTDSKPKVSVMGTCLSLFSSQTRNVSQQQSNHNELPATSSTEDLIPERVQLEPPPSLQSLEKEIRSGLRALMKKSSDLENSKIILGDDLRGFWTDHYTQFYKRQLWYDPRWDRTNLVSDYQRIISILILIQFKDWKHFRNMFIDRGRADAELPFNREELNKESFLGSDIGPYFWECQWIVSPLVIEERQEPYHLTGDEVERRFPYVEKERKIGAGVSCTVYRQVIAARHLKYSRQARESDNTKVGSCFFHCDGMKLMINAAQTCCLQDGRRGKGREGGIHEPSNLEGISDFS